jgi:hypothetical protein
MRKYQRKPITLSLDSLSQFVQELLPFFYLFLPLLGFFLFSLKKLDSLLLLQSRFAFRIFLGGLGDLLFLDRVGSTLEAVKTVDVDQGLTERLRLFSRNFDAVLLTAIFEPAQQIEGIFSLFLCQSVQKSSLLFFVQFIAS